VSVVVPTFNRADVLPRALDSVVHQTVIDWEIILIDDGSSDDTRQLADRYARDLGDRFVFLRQENRGCCHARNRGIAQARGSFIAFLDSDDAFVPTKLERQLQLFARCPQLGLVFSDYACVNLAGSRIESAFGHFYPTVRSLKTNEVAPGLHECAASIFKPLLRGYFIATIVGMVRRKVLGDDIRFAEHLPYAHEWLFYLEIARRCGVGFVDEPLSVHHFTQGSLSRTDAAKNLLDFYTLVQEMPHTLAPLRRSERSIIRGHLAKTAREIGVTCYHAGAFADARRWFLRSFKHEQHPRSLVDALDSWRQCIRHSTRTRTPAHGE